MGWRSLAAAGAAFAVGFIFCIWLMHDDRLTGASAAEPRAFVVADARSDIAETDIRNSRRHLASLEAGPDFASRWQDISSEANSTRASFGERFAFRQASASLQTAQARQIPFSFDHGFSSGVLSFEGPGLFATAAPRTRDARSSVPVTAPRVAARAAAARFAPKRAPKAAVQLASASDASLPLAYAPAEPATRPDPANSLKDLLQIDSDSLAGVDASHTAIYDIASHTVYLPNGRRLEAHSGLGSHMDDPRSVASRMIGPTPPNVYDLKMRESLFHGVRAIRLIPKDDSKMHGRTGILAHSYMLGPNGQSNGCVSFRDYAAFLNAYERGDVTHLVVVKHLAGAPSSKTAADWFSNALKKIFRRS